LGTSPARRHAAEDPGLVGVTPWILADFLSPRRVLPNAQDGWPGSTHGGNW